MSRFDGLYLAQALFCLSSLIPLNAQQIPSLTPLAPGQLWQGMEFRVNGVPAVPNAFDPDVIRVDAVFRLPSARAITVPGFWYQAYQRTLSGASERLGAEGLPEWRVRFTPPEPGDYSTSVAVTISNQPYASSEAVHFTVSANVAPPRAGYVRVGQSGQYLETGNGQTLKLIGENVCWHGSRGTYDYDDWFPAMQAAGANFARLWMWPNAFGIEVEPNALVNYRLDRAWQLDYVMRLAEQHGIYLLLCLDYHGMYEEQPDSWGGNNFWSRNPYNQVNGGPCLNQNGFFTNPTARSLYQKRLRYLVARYGYSPNLLAWEFFNEIDNVYRYLVPADVAAWHGVMGDWLHGNDPFGHLVTTSLTGSSDRQEIWTLPQLDFAAYHSYNEPEPSVRLAQVAQSFLNRYKKPVMIGEFGTDWRGWNQAGDPYLRGFRQGIWGGALGGALGTGMSWWWESIHAKDAYPIFTAVDRILSRTGWCAGSWTNVGFHSAGPPPISLGNLVPDGQPFDVFLTLGTAWGAKPMGLLAVANPDSAGYSASRLNAFFHGTVHPDLRVPFRLTAWLTNNARLVMHLNSVSSGSILTVRVDGVERYRTNLPNLDGGYSVNNEFNVDLAVNVPAGRRVIDIVNAGADWFLLDWVRLEAALPALYQPEWAPSPQAIGIRGPHEALVYVVAPGASYPANATNAVLPLQESQLLSLTNWPPGCYFAEWRDPRTGTNLDLTASVTTNGTLQLPLPAFREDLAGIVYPQPRLSADLDQAQNPVLRLESETAGVYSIEKSTDFTNWTSWVTFTNYPGNTSIAVPASEPQSFFRARR